jgi:hypothetical protein
MQVWGQGWHWTSPWFDWYSVNPNGEATGDASAKGYLGLPLGDVYNVPAYYGEPQQVTDEGVFRRDYEGGSVFVNAIGSVAVEIPIEKKFKRILGDPELQQWTGNDGSIVEGSVFLEKGDGVILLNPD